MIKGLAIKVTGSTKLKNKQEKKTLKKDKMMKNSTVMMFSRSRRSTCRWPKRSRLTPLFSSISLLRRLSRSWIRSRKICIVRLICIRALWTISKRSAVHNLRLSEVIGRSTRRPKRSAKMPSVWTQSISTKLNSRNRRNSKSAQITQLKTIDQRISSDSSLEMRD